MQKKLKKVLTRRHILDIILLVVEGNTVKTFKNTECGLLAQSVEHLTFNQGVPRSNRGQITIFWPVGQAVKTPPFHGGNRSSILLRVTIFFINNFQCGVIAQLGEHLPYKQGVTGSSPVNPTIKTEHAGVAQLAEQLTCNQQVVGSIPITSSIYTLNLDFINRIFFYLFL